MTIAVILFPPPYLQRDAWLPKTKDQLIAAYQENRYSIGAAIQVSEELTNCHVAEELFDLTNDPGRQEEREEKYGRGRSLSIGDIVKVGQHVWLCQSIGWVQSLSMPQAI